MPNITVIIPVLNGMPYLTECLASLHVQSVKDFEVLLWDNGSTDGTVEEAECWIPGRLPGRVVKESPLPLHTCLARMVEECGTKFIARMDADDICLPDRFEKQLNALQRNPEVALVGAQMELMDSESRDLGPAEASPLGFCDILFAFLFRNPLAHPTVMFRRQEVLDAGNYAWPKPVEDLELWMRLAQQAALINLPDTVLRYRRHPDAICGDLGQDNADLLKETLEVACQQLPDLIGLSSRELKAIRDQTCRISFFPLWKAARTISKRTDTPVRHILGRKENLYIARCLTRDNDWLSKTAWKILEWL